MRKVTAYLLCLLVPTVPTLGEAPSLCAQEAEKSAAVTLLTNKDVLEMFKIGLTPELIMAKIRSTPSQFDTSVTALQELKSSNVPDAIILAMIEASPAAMPAATPAEQVVPNSVALGPPSKEVTPTKIAVPDGTPVEIELLENVSSEAVQEGSPIDFTVVQPVEVNGVVVVARGAPAKGRVVEVKKARHWGRAGKLVWAIQDVHAVDGQRLPLRLSKELEGGGSSGKVAAAVVVTAIFFWPAAPLWGLKKGKPAIIPAGTRVTSFTHGESAVQVESGGVEK